MQDGQPTGILVDTAMPLVEDCIPAPTVEDARRLILAAQEHCLAYGLTQVHDPGIDATMLQAYRSLASDGELKMRVHAMVRQEHIDEVGLTRVDEGLFTLRCVKVLMDGALGSYGAAMEEPYEDAPHEMGLLRVTPESLRDTLERSYRSGFQVSVHAIGDRTNRLALDAIEEVLQRVPTADHRTRIEHAQILRPQDVGRFAQLGVIASVQPSQCTSDIDMSDVRLGPRRAPNAYMWRSLLEAGTTLTGGSDAPVESANPLWGIYAAVTRQDNQGRPPGGWNPGQRMTRGEALAAYTFGPAYASFQDADRGALRPGQWADITIIDRDVVDGPAVRPARSPGAGDGGRGQRRLRPAPVAGPGPATRMCLPGGRFRRLPNATEVLRRPTAGDSGAVSLHCTAGSRWRPHSLSLHPSTLPLFHEFEELALVQFPSPYALSCRRPASPWWAASSAE